MVTDDILVFPAFRLRAPPSDAERRRRLILDGLSWLVVAIIHVAFFLVLVISLQQNHDRLGRRTAFETMIDLSLLHRSDASRFEVLNPEEQKAPTASSAPLTIPPPVIIMPVIPPNAGPAPGDVLKSIGEALACGASNFEYLNRVQQLRCRRQPWQGVKLPNGTIVLEAPPRAAAPQVRLTGADEIRRLQQTNSGCPIMLNTPCLQDMFTGNNSANPGTPAH